MESANLYRAFYISRVPNNHCEICSFFKPENDFHFAANRSWAHCPSCGRLCMKYFVDIDRLQELQPERVPDEWITRPHFGPDKIGEQVKPQFSRPAWHDDYWRDYFRDNYSPANKVSRAQSDYAEFMAALQS